MNVQIDDSWHEYLKQEFDKPYFHDLVEFVKNEYSNYQCYPKGKDIFKAFEHSKFEATKVVIIGQDPYHGAGQANGLCFSVQNGVSHPPSLINILKELEQDLGYDYPSSGDLSPWAQQGVLLLNACLSVRAGMAGSHQNKGWEVFTDAVIQQLNKNKKGLVFLLWGGFAKKKKRLIDMKQHMVLESGHPSPLSANRGYWFGNRHFSKTNSLLEQAGYEPIYWKLT
jgi:uracil-DNA glycosylase